MHLAILGADGWHTRDLLRAAAEYKVRADTIDFRNLTAGVSADGDSLNSFDAVLVRTMPAGSLEQVVFRMDVLHRAQARGVRVVNPPLALESCIDKYLATAKLEAAGLNVPPTMACQRADDALAAFERLGGDVIVKPLFGSEGRGMVRVSDPEIAWRTLHALDRTGCVIYLQQFVPHPGWDLRVFVLGGRILAAMRRYARDDWRTNVAQGGRAEPVMCSDREAELALRAAAAVGAEVAGVDLLPGPAGELFVLEVNGVPGWRALGPACGVDVATEIVRHLVRTAGM